MVVKVPDRIPKIFTKSSRKLLLSPATFSGFSMTMISAPGYTIGLFKKPYFFQIYHLTEAHNDCSMRFFVPPEFEI